MPRNVRSVTDHRPAGPRTPAACSAPRLDEAGQAEAFGRASNVGARHHVHTYGVVRRCVAARGRHAIDAGIPPLLALAKFGGQPAAAPAASAGGD